jgi:hypothetical protein
MPIKIPDNLPASGILTGENIFVMNEERAAHQDIRPLRIAILNLMPNKITTETQLLRLVGNTPIQVDVVLLYPDSLARIHGPAGLDLGGGTPAETALAIVAEIVAVRAGRSGGSLREVKGRIHADTDAAPAPT